MGNKNNNNGIGSGFLLGILIGVLLALLLTTKKGREILRELVDKAIHKISDLDKSSEENQQKSDGENDYVKSKPEEVKKEIRYLAADSAASKDVLETLPKQTEEKPANEKGGKQKKPFKRLFFQKTQTKKLEQNEK